MKRDKTKPAKPKIRSIAKTDEISGGPYERLTQGAQLLKKRSNSRPVLLIMKQVLAEILEDLSEHGDANIEEYGGHGVDFFAEYLRRVEMKLNGKRAGLPPPRTRQDNDLASRIKLYAGKATRSMTARKILEGSGQTRLAAIRTVGGTQDPQMRAALEKALLDNDLQVVREAAAALTHPTPGPLSPYGSQWQRGAPRLKHDAALEKLLASPNNRSYDALYALAHFDDARVDQHFLETLETSERSRAFMLVAERQLEKAIPLLERVAREESKDAPMALAALHHFDTPRARKIFSDEKLLQALVTRILSPKPFDSIRDTWAPAREPWIRALPLFGGPPAEETLLAVLQMSEEELDSAHLVETGSGARAAAAEAFLKVAAPRHIELLAKWLWEGDDFERVRCAVGGLAKLTREGSTQARAKLEEMAAIPRGSRPGEWADDAINGAANTLQELQRSTKGGS